MKDEFDEVEDEMIEQLRQLNKYQKINVEDVEIDHQLIKAAVDKGIAIRERRELYISNIIFILTALMIFIIAISLVTKGYVFILLALQILMIVITPLVIPLAIRRHLKGGAI